MPMTTKAQVMWEPDQWWDLVELELDDPKDHEVLIRFEASGLCHSDDHVRTGDARCRYPMVGGHEGAGVIEQVGPKVARVGVGDRVVCSYIPMCGTCRYCATGLTNLCDSGRNAGTGMLLDDTFRFHKDGQDLGGMCVLGTFSERAVISEYACVPLPDDISFEVASLVGCGVPTGWGSAVRAAGVRAGQTVVIYGSGGVGANTVQGAALAGAKNVVVVDPVPFKLEMAAKEFGATHTFTDPAEAHDFVVETTWGQLADHAIVTAGVVDKETVDRAVLITGKGGRVTITGIGKADELQLQMHCGLLIGYQRDIQGALFGNCSPLYDIPMLLGLYRSGDLKLDELISNRYRLDQVNDGYQDLLDGKNIRGVVLHEH
ncbi:S-(hydroxymethyl)glutathione dehydrogenase/alcohol dehydrogenase [Lipingzhangella halophila]|uniref:S-(Hydroxymethyl)glutathione dehydrogenase/alcohol dehydrogenase n=1 Tax=Lipingzhangella halophila TaxID=1783352 RepID=A0A7W7RFT6_9ACTN|nr:NDMA-dependent alcohol dehydrogenase [Lipingzhangella halophila]MBB4931206.1 S-(hydroxymethyl)glutathione dehydrogenase/alcohol dehydrogenase [Lipingzhangella halophila]